MGEPDLRLTGLYVLGAAVVILPFLLYRYPLCTDYFAHLAWMSVLLSPAESPVRRVFDVHYTPLIPNLGLPIFTLALGKFLSAAAILAVYNLLGIVGIAGGAIVLSRSIHGRLYPTILLILPILHSSVVSYGLYNFVVGIALVLLTLVLVQQKTFAPKFLTLNLCAPILFLIHLGALGCLALTVLLLEIEQERPRYRALLIAPLYFISTIPFYLFRARPPISRPLAFSNLPGKLIGISSLFDDGNMVIAVVCALIALMVVVILYRSGVSLAPGWRLVVIGLWMAAWAAPSIMEISAVVDGRTFWYAALLTVAAARVPDSRSAFVTRLIVPAVAAMIAIKMGFEIRTAGVYNRNVDELAAAMNVIPPGAPVFVSLASDRQDALCTATTNFPERRFFWHIADLSSVAGRGLDTTMFVQKGVVVVQPKAAFSEYFPLEPIAPPPAPLAAYLFDHDQSSPLIRELTRSNTIGWPASVDVLDYSLNWGKRYPYLIYINSGCEEDPFASKLKLVAHGSFFKIYHNTEINISLY